MLNGIYCSMPMIILRKFYNKISTFVRNHILMTGGLVLLVVGASFYAYSSFSTPAVELTTQNPVRKDLTKTLSVSGVIEAKEKARLRFLSGGKVVYVGAKEGEAVTRGQTIATIDQRALKKQLDQNLNQFTQERLNWDQTNVNIFKNEYTTDEERTREKAELDLINKALTVEIQTVAIENTRLTAPFAGILTVSPTLVSGVQLTAADFFEIVNPDTLIFKAAVDEIDLAGLSVGLPASINLDAYPSNDFSTSLNYIAFTAVDTPTRTVFFVEFPIDTQNNEQSLFRIGMNGEAKITIETKNNALTIPLRSTRERAGKTYVDVLLPDKQNQTEEREITVGLETNTEIEVLSGLTENDLVVIP